MADLEKLAINLCQKRFIQQGKSWIEGAGIDRTPCEKVGRKVATRKRFWLFRRSCGIQIPQEEGLAVVLEAMDERTQDRCHRYDAHDRYWREGDRERSQ